MVDTGDAPGGTAFWTPGGGGGLVVQQGGVTVDPKTTTENFTGSGVSVVDTVAGTVQVDIPGFQGLFRSPDGSCWKVTIANDGTPTYTKVTCPGNAAPTIVGGLLTSSNAHQSVGNPLNSSGGNVNVSAGQLLVVIAGHASSVNTSPATSVSDTAGNVWTEHTSGWSGSNPDTTFFKVSIYTAIANASGLTNVTVHQDGSALNMLAWAMYSITGYNAAVPIGVTGSSATVTHGVGGATYSQFVTTAGTPAPNSFIIAANINAFYNAGFEPPNPAVYTPDPAFTNLIQYEPGNPWLEFGLRIDTNPGGATSSLWTNIPIPNNGAGSLEMSVSYIMEIRAA